MTTSLEVTEITVQAVSVSLSRTTARQLQCHWWLVLISGNHSFATASLQLLAQCQVGFPFVTLNALSMCLSTF
jgi:hypothetical protein